MKSILVEGAGGVAGIGMTRCLANDYIVFGNDTSPYGRLAMEAKPYTNEAVDLMVPVPDAAVPRFVGKPKTLLPDKLTVEICQDKARCAAILGDLAPKTYWVRDTHGAGGKGAQMASQFLPGKNFSCELAYFNGELIGHFIKERLSYSVKNNDGAMDKRGSSAVSVCVNNPIVLLRAKEAIGMIMDKPHGAFGVDFKEDEYGVPLITEINPGRFLTASYTYFYSTGYNLPLALVKAYFGEEYKLGKYPEGEMVIRQTDCSPKFFNYETINVDKK